MGDAVKHVVRTSLPKPAGPPIEPFGVVVIDSRTHVPNHRINTQTGIGAVPLKEPAEGSADERRAEPVSTWPPAEFESYSEEADDGWNQPLSKTWVIALTAFMLVLTGVLIVGFGLSVGKGRSSSPESQHPARSDVASTPIVTAPPLEPVPTTTAAPDESRAIPLESLPRVRTEHKVTPKSTLPRHFVIKRRAPPVRSPLGSTDRQ
jgi:hypothetical protein